MTDTPPDWVLIEAAKRFGWDRGRPISALQKDYEVSTPFRAFCDMILKHEQPPVDRKLLCAREACAERYEGTGDVDIAAAYRNGLYDGDRNQTIAFRAIELWEEGFGK